MPNKEISVLLLDADDTRAGALEAIFHECNYCSKITRVNSIHEAKDLLEDSYQKYRSMPSLIVAYLVPQDAGFVEIMKKHDVFKHVPLIGYGELNSTEEIESYYKQHINCFIVLPKTDEEFKDTFRNIFKFWSETVKLVHTEKLIM
ncbi:MAG: hypothetical protein ACXWDO_10720 [Bacteroidia bacterium]